MVVVCHAHERWPRKHAAPTKLENGLELQPCFIHQQGSGDPSEQCLERENNPGVKFTPIISSCQTLPRELSRGEDTDRELFLVNDKEMSEELVDG